ncbi:MAG: LamG domain-containing protein [Planctomycetes bacterium]|nr:LamG domain-containing protein [Planctomycetota bacterium]
MRTLKSLVVAFALAGAAVSQNQAIQLTTGVDGGVDYAYDPLMLPATGITVEAWVTFDDSTVPTGFYYWPTVARQNVNPNQESWNLRVSSGNAGARSLQFIIRTTANALYSATYNFAAGEFLQPTHLAGTFDGQTIRIHKNGVQVATYVIPGTYALNNLGGTLRVGNGDPVAPGREAWNGTIDELRVWPMARTAGEIAASMGQELAGMPGGVLAFHMNGTYDETDHNLVGSTFGTIGFVPSQAALTSLAPLTFQQGAATTTCTRIPELTLGSAPTLGNADFSLYCVRGPLPANANLGVVIAAFGAAPGSQPPFFGVNLAFDINTVVAQSLLLPATTLLGNARFQLPLPSDPSFTGVGFLFQFGFQDAACGPQGFTASNGLLFLMQ